MTALATRPARVPAPVLPAVESTRNWVRAAACRFDRSDVDLTELTDAAHVEASKGDGGYVVHERGRVRVRDYEADLAAARALCDSCPVLARCRASALSGPPLAGFVAGMTEAEREERRLSDAAPDGMLFAVPDYEHVGVVETLMPSQITAALVNEADEIEAAETGVRRAVNSLTGRQYVAVARLTLAGLTAEEVGDRMGLSDTTVDYVRQVFSGSKPARPAAQAAIALMRRGRS